MGMYLNNCKLGLHGPLEVFSRQAVYAWIEGLDRCQRHFHRLCSGDCMWGEDMFIDQCLSKVVGVERVDDWGLLAEDHCDAPDGWRDCDSVNHWRVAYHPFKQKEDFQQCLNRARR